MKQRQEHIHTQDRERMAELVGTCRMTVSYHGFKVSNTSLYEGRGAEGTEEKKKKTLAE